MATASKTPDSRRVRAKLSASGGERSLVSPPAPSSFLGRVEELSQLSGLLEGERLVTLVGAPGIGKTRLALELAAQLGGGYPGGAHVVELSSIARPAHVARAVASALRVDEQSGQSLTDMIIARLARRRVVLVLDNCEHVLGACAKLVDALLAGCLQLRVLATSREALGIDAERVWEVPPLMVPDHTEEHSPEALAGYAAVGLFVERARALQPGFSLNAHVAPAVIEVCRRLDGIPLAIELAAARVQSLTPPEIAGRLNDRFGLLSKGSAGEPARHQTLEAALDWSHELLAAPERALLRGLSAFTGGFDVQAVEAVCASGDIEAGQIGYLLAGLAAKSLVVVQPQGSRTARYRLLETIRAYAGERLEEAGETTVLRDAHARFYLTLAEEAEPELTGPHQEDWLKRLEAERANLRSAIEWSLSHGEKDEALRLAGALVLFWRVRCHFSEGRELLDAAVSASGGSGPALRAKALWGAGFMALMEGDLDAAVPPLEESLARFRELEDRQGCARALLVLGNCREYREPMPLLAESAALARKADDSWCLAHALALAGFEHVSRHELPAARPLFEECLALARKAEDKQSLRFALLGLGRVAVGQGDYGLAKSLFEEALSIARKLGEDYVEAITLQDLGELALYQGDDGGAGELLNDARALLPAVAPLRIVRAPLFLLARVAHAQGDRRSAHLFFDQAQALLGIAMPTMALQWMGELAAEEGDLGRAHRLFEEALGLARASGDNRGTAQALRGLGQLARDAGDAGRAAELQIEALELERHIGDAPGIATSLEAVAGLAAAAGGHELAARLFGAAQALRDRGGYAHGPWESSHYQADVTLARQGLGAQEFNVAWAQGAGLSIHDAATLAAKGHERLTGGWDSLTKAEQQVAALVAEGLTNQEITERLLMSLGTVKTHMSHIFSKLGVARRSQLAGEVWRRRS